MLHREEIKAALVGTRFASHFHHFPTIDSTNTRLLAAAADGSPEGTVFVADEQTAGRGRGGHNWHSAPGDGLYLSVLVKPSLRLREALWLSLATGLAARAAIHTAACIDVDLRWPNDLLFSNQKLGGILVETSAGSGADAPLHYAVIGIGINLNHESFPNELYPLATSLRLITGHRQNRQSLLITLLRALDSELTQLEDANATNAAEPKETVLERFTKASGWVFGRRVSVPEQGGYTGTTAGLDSRGFLLVDADDGSQRTVLSGGVRDLL
jgi:BirA family transcriptional regulator, biotin operon repressor / biotin---[acetyl-CoA-carboxylase] ligase